MPWFETLRPVLTPRMAVHFSAAARKSLAVKLLPQATTFVIFGFVRGSLADHSLPPASEPCMPHFQARKPSTRNCSSVVKVRLYPAICEIAPFHRADVTSGSPPIRHTVLVL